MRRSALILVLVLVVLGVMAAPAIAQPPDPHDHFLVVPGTDEEVQIGPKRCDVGESLQGAFLNFHDNVHVGKPWSVAGLIIRPEFC